MENTGEEESINSGISKVYNLNLRPWGSGGQVDEYGTEKNRRVGARWQVVLTVDEWRWL